MSFLDYTSDNNNRCIIACNDCGFISHDYNESYKYKQAGWEIIPHRYKHYGEAICPVCLLKNLIVKNINIKFSPV